MYLILILFYWMFTVSLKENEKMYAIALSRLLLYVTWCFNYDNSTSNCEISGHDNTIHVMFSELPNFSGTAKTRVRPAG
jgi:hypothetical protein